MNDKNKTYMLFSNAAIQNILFVKVKLVKYVSYGKITENYKNLKF